MSIPRLSAFGQGVNGIHDEAEQTDSRVGCGPRCCCNGGASLTANPPLKAPFPWIGGKARVADIVWNRLGNVRNYCEPFAGSIAVLLRRPAEHFADGYRVETITDVNHFVTNFWRSVTFAPDETAKWCDQPVSEVNMHAAHKWLIRSAHAAEYRKQMKENPDYFDAKIAGRWCHGQCCWIGGAWCDDVRTDYEQMPQIDRDAGVNGGRPQLTDAYDIGRGVNASPPHLPEKRPLLGGPGDAPGNCGVISNPHLGRCDARRLWLTDWMRRLSDRLRLVRTCYGHWSRICDSDSTLTRLGTTGVFLDPPYPTRRADGTKSRDGSLYASDKNDDTLALRDEVLSWCRKWGEDPQIRIAVCGYEGDGYEALEGNEGWAVVAWESNGGYGNQRKKGGKKSENAARERLWFSPACLVTTPAPTLFDGLEDEC
jgi:DNA adenine methylase